MNEALLRRLMGIKDARGKVGIYSRGKNVYRGGSNAAHAGGGVQYGRPTNEALARRVRRLSGAK